MSRGGVEWTLFSLGTDPDVQDNIEHKSEARVDHRLDSPDAALLVPTEAQAACSRAGGVTHGIDCLGRRRWRGGNGIARVRPKAALTPEYSSPNTLHVVNGRIDANGRIAWVFVGTLGTV